MIEETALARRRLGALAADLDARALVPAADADVPSIAALINRAFRNIGDAKGWTSEEAYMTGERTRVADLRADMRGSPEGALLTWRRRSPGAIEGCVWLEPLDAGSWSMGALSIEPSLQNASLGRRLLAEAESWMAARGAREVEITVVNVRDTLIAWYERRGYVLTGETRPWPYEDDRYGAPVRDDLCFVVLRKTLDEGEPHPLPDERPKTRKTRPS